MPDFDADDDDDQPDKDDEKPVVVVLKKGDLTAEEAEDIQKSTKASDEPPSDGKITFKKPEKRSSDTKSELNASSSKKKKDSPKSVKSNCKKVKDKKLLSFGNEDDEDEDT